MRKETGSDHGSGTSGRIDGRRFINSIYCVLSLNPQLLCSGNLFRETERVVPDVHVSNELNGASVIMLVTRIVLRCCDLADQGK